MSKNEPSKPKQKRQNMGMLCKKIASYTRQEFITMYNEYLQQSKLKLLAKKLGTTEHLLRKFVDIKFDFVSPRGKSSKCSIPFPEC